MKIKESFERIKENLENNPLTPFEVSAAVLVGAAAALLGLAGGAIIIAGEPNTIFSEKVIQGIGVTWAAGGLGILVMLSRIGAKILAGTAYSKKS